MTPPQFLIKLASAIVGNRLATAGAWGLIALLAYAALSVGKCTYDRRIIADHDSKVTQHTLTLDAKAKDEAAAQRARDVISIDQAEKERNDAIETAPAGKPSPAAVRLGCERLRRAGIDASSFAECR